MDYGTLAQLSRPQMRGNAPMGAGATAGVEYDQDRQRWTEALGGAGQLANIDLQNQRTGSQEYQAGSPGRLADINTNNSLAQGKNAQIGDLLSTQSTDIKTKGIKADTEQIKAEIEKLAPYVGEWSQAKDNPAKEEIKSRMDSKGVKIGIRSMSEIPIDKLDLIMQQARSAQVQTPAHVGKMEEIGATAAGHKETATILAGSRVQVAEIQAAAKKRAAEMYAQAKAMSPMNLSQWEASQYIAMGKGEMSPMEVAAFGQYMARKMAEAQAKAANQPPNLNPEAVKEGAPPGTDLLKPPVIPAVPPIPPQQGKPAPPPPAGSSSCSYE